MHQGQQSPDAHATGRRVAASRFVPLVEFAINYSASPLCSWYTPFFADLDRCMHPRRHRRGHRGPDGARDDQGAGAASGAAGQGTRRGYAHRRDVHFAVGDEVFFDTEHAPVLS